MAEKLNVQVLVGLVDRLTRPLRALRGNVARETGALDALLSKTANLTLVGGALAQSGAAVLAPVRSATAAFADAEDAATRFRLSMMDATGAVLPSYQALTALAQQLGDRLPGSTADFLQMMTMLRRQGMDATTILAGTGEAAANLAVMLRMTPEGAGEFAAKLQDATGTASADMLTLADTIQRVFNVGVDPGNLLEAFSALAPAMAIIRQQGLSGAQAMAPLIALLDQASLSGEAAGNALRKVFAGAFGGSKKQNEAIEDAGLVMVSDRGEFLGLENLFAQLAKLRTVSAEERLATLGDIWGDDSETLQALNTMIEKGAAGYAQMADKLREQADLNQRMTVLLGTLKNLWDAASGTVTNLAARLGELLAPEIKALTEALGRWAAQARGWIDAHPALAKGIAGWVVGLGAAMVVLGGLSLAIGGLAGVLAVVLGPLRLAGRLLGLLLTPLRALPGAFAATAAGTARLAAGLRGMTLALALTQGGLAKVGFVLRALGAGLVANPIGLAVAALATAALAIVKYWEPIKGFFSGLWAGLAEGLAPLAPAFTGAFAVIEPLLRPVKAALSWLWETLTGLLEPVQDVGGAAEAMGRRFGLALADLLRRALALLADLKAWAKDMAALGADLVTGLWDGLKSRWEALATWWREKTAWLGGVLRTQTETHSPSRVFAAIGADLIAGLQQGLTARLPAVWEAMRQLASGLQQGLAVRLPALPGDLRQWAAVVGAGALAASPPAPAASGPPRAFAGGISMPISITIQAPPGADPQRLADLVRREVLTATRQAGRRLAALYDGSDGL